MLATYNTSIANYTFTKFTDTLGTQFFQNQPLQPDSRDSANIIAPDLQSRAPPSITAPKTRRPRAPNKAARAVELAPPAAPALDIEFRPGRRTYLLFPTKQTPQLERDEKKKKKKLPEREREEEVVAQRAASGQSERRGAELIDHSLRARVAAGKRRNGFRVIAVMRLWRIEGFVES